MKGVNTMKRIRIKGFSVIELLIALAIFVTSFCMIIGIFPVTFRSIQMSKNFLLATNLAEQKMEYAKSLPFSDIDTTHLANESITMFSTVNGVQQTLRFTCNYQLSAPSSTSDPYYGQIKYITVMVTWQYGVQQEYIKLQSSVAKLN